MAALCQVSYGPKRPKCTRRCLALQYAWVHRMSGVCYGARMRMGRLLALAAIIAAGVPLVGVWQGRFGARPSSSQQTATRILRIGIATVRVEVARTPEEHRRGLSNRDTLLRDAGMLFEFPATERKSFWMKDTRMPLDILWIRDGRVLAVTAGARPEPGVPDFELHQYPSPGPVDRVLEVNAGWAARHGVVSGTMVRWE